MNGRGLPTIGLVTAAVTVGLLMAGATASRSAVPALAQEVARPHILLIATGGTIASRAGSPEQLGSYRVSDTGKELVAAVPAIDAVARVSVEQFSNKPSTAVDPEDWLELARMVNSAFRPDGPWGEVDGVVITHGTDTLEETAFFLNYTVKSPKPVVVVGAMRPASAISADGPLNLLSAIRVAAHPDSSGRGVMVVLNQEINAARDVTKSNTHMVQTFVSRRLGLLGMVDDEGPVFYRRSERRHTVESEFDVSSVDVDELPRVDVSYTYAGADGTDVDAFVAAGARGIVVAAAGAGSTTRGQRLALRRAADQGVVVCRSSRTGSGRVGSGAARGATVTAADLLPQKARILLMLALTVTDEPAEIQRIFNTY